MPNKLLSDDAFNNNLNIRIIRLASKITLLMLRTTFRPAGLSGSEVRVLIHLARFGDTHLRSIARKTSLDASHLSKVMVQMEKAGFVSRSKDKNDKRLVLFSLAPEGEKMLELIWPELRDFASDVSDQINDADFPKVKGAIDNLDLYVQSLLDQHQQKAN